MAYDFDIDYSLRAAVDGGPALSKTGTIEVGAFDMLKGTAAKSGGTASFDLTAEDPATVEFFSVESSNYEDLIFAIDGGDSITLDGPIMLTGAGQVSLLGATMATIVFTNRDTVAAANITIRIGRSGVYTPA
ncbi:MAG TPA: hypothetical protein PKJ51_00125 [Methanothrix sp.]|jgi:hypothetical protein|nr:hypothetical protein [Methanothrix sp.]